MLKEYDSLFRRLIVIVDIALVCVAFFASYYLQKYLADHHVDFLGGLYPIRVYFKVLPLTLLMWCSGLYFFGGYDVFRGKGFWDITKSVIKSTAALLVLFAVVFVLFKFYYISRAFIALNFLITGMFLAAHRLAIVKVLRDFRRKGYNYKYVLIVGTGARARGFIEHVHAHPEWGLRIAGLIDEDPELVGTQILGYDVLGTLEDVPLILQNKVIDDVFFVVPRSWLGKIEDVMLHCEQLGKRVSVALDYFNLQFARARQNNLGGFPMLTFETTSDKFFQLMMKRLFDIIVSAVSLILLSPVFLILAVLVKMTSEGPVFFRQVRSGLNGRRFILYKFRTMVVDAEARLEKLKKFNEMSGPVFKMNKDPRITPIGAWMRKFSLDELPQLINVFHGDMSLVGPRPPIPAEVSQYETWHRRRLSMAPGITGLWQVNGRNNIVDFDEWMRLDLAYIDKWSLGLDFSIIAKTIPAVIMAKGAK